MNVIRHAKTGEYWDGSEWVDDKDCAEEFDTCDYEPLPKWGVILERTEQDTSTEYVVTWYETVYYSYGVCASDEDEAKELAQQASDNGYVNLDDHEYSNMTVEEA